MVDFKEALKCSLDEGTFIESILVLEIGLIYFVRLCTESPFQNLLFKIKMKDLIFNFLVENTFWGFFFVVLFFGIIGGFGDAYLAVKGKLETNYLNKGFLWLSFKYGFSCAIIGFFLVFGLYISSILYLASKISLSYNMFILSLIFYVTMFFTCLKKDEWIYFAVVIFPLIILLMIFINLH